MKRNTWFAQELSRLREEAQITAAFMSIQKREQYNAVRLDAERYDRLDKRISVLEMQMDLLLKLMGAK